MRGSLTDLDKSGRREEKGKYFSARVSTINNFLVVYLWIILICDGLEIFHSIYAVE
jgi:hypothetical protein